MAARPSPTLELARFVPFRLNRLAAGVSEHLSAIYRARFSLDVPAWRVMATVGQLRRCTAQQVAESTRMHKTRVSRAIAQLVRRGLIARSPAPADRRNLTLRLTGAGRRLYAQLVPLALARERTLLSCLSRAERRAFLAGMTRLERFLSLSGPRAR